MKDELIKMLAKQAGVSVKEFEAKVAEKRAAAAERDADRPPMTRRPTATPRTPSGTTGMLAVRFGSTCP